jgi:predicted nucleic acid-binding protein
VVIYADTSFLVSLYGQDANSEQARRTAREQQRPFPWTELLQHETRNAFRLGVFRKEITDQEMQQLLKWLDEDQRSGILHAFRLEGARVYEIAEKLSDDFTSKTGNRAMDILHVAAALHLKADLFLSFDQRQRALAQQAGMQIEP